MACLGGSLGDSGHARYKPTLRMVALLSFYQGPAGKVCGSELPAPTLRG